MLAQPTHDLDGCLEQIERLRVFPVAAVRIMRVARSPDASLWEMEEAVAADPVLAARVLTAANSPFAGLRSKVSTLNRAVQVMGLIGTRDIALMALVGSVAGTVAPWGSLFHRHALLTAHFSRLLAGEVRDVDGSEAFVTGLLHDLGSQLLLALEEAAVVTLLEKFHTRPMLLERAERLHFGFDHAQLSAACVRRWELPESVARVIEAHHEPPVVGEVSRAVVVLQVADQLAECAADGADAVGLAHCYRDHAVSSLLNIPQLHLVQLMLEAERVIHEL